jgi:lipopolysaccharide transport system ATP-binding protein
MLKKKAKANKKIIIEVKNVTKNFKIPQEKADTLRGSFVNFYRKKRYEKFTAVKNLSFKIKEGEFFGIIGRNGSGKSTLLKMLAGIYYPDKGELKVKGGISPFLELGVGFNPELSGRDNIFLNATILGLTKEEIKRKYDQIVNFSELNKFIDQKLKKYSSGMQVRLAFSIAIHANKDILLMDEVLAVGDSNFQEKCLDEFNRYKRMGKTVILVTHDVSVVKNYCNRAMLLRNGQKVLLDKADKVVDLYIKQNIKDEESRYKRQKEFDQKSNKNKSELEEIKSFDHDEKAVAIKRVEFFDKSKKRKRVFSTGEDITARIHYFAARKIKKPVFGLALYDKKDIHISGPNTKTSDFIIDYIYKDGYLDFTIKKNIFFTGTFYLTVAVFDWTSVIPYDVKDKAFSFKIISKEKNQYGLIKVEHEFNHVKK